ncbi:hypothetical protein XFEB_00229 [Xylella fastidiosa EB92.1]|nr:hypothetical protein XFEB_00229 [Xylella fastidiosa EB92.1]
MRKGAAEIRVGKTAECAPETAISGGRYSKEVRAVNRANTGGTGKKNPNRIRVGISHYGGGGRNRTAVRKYSVPGPTCLSWPLGLVAGQHDRQSAPGNQSARFNQGWADGHVSAVP